MTKSVEEIREEVEQNWSKTEATWEHLEDDSWFEVDESLVGCSFVMPFRKWINVLTEDGSYIPYDEWEWNPKNNKKK